MAIYVHRAYFSGKSIVRAQQTSSFCTIYRSPILVRIRSAARTVCSIARDTVLATLVIFYTAATWLDTYSRCLMVLPLFYSLLFYVLNGQDFTSAQLF